jgi:hypothetical protein
MFALWCKSCRGVALIAYRAARAFAGEGSAMSRCAKAVAMAAALVSCALLVASCGMPSAADPRTVLSSYSLHATASQEGGVFFNDQSAAHFTVATNATSVGWTATGYSGSVFDTGKATVAAGTATITLPIAANVWGWYDLHLVGYAGSSSVVTADTDFAIIGRPAATVADSRFGYSAHISKVNPEDPPETLPLLADAETSLVRTDLPYDEPNALSFPHTAVLQAAKNLGATPLLILDSWRAIQSADIAAWARFAQAAAQHYAGLTHYYEIDNEYNEISTGACANTNIAANAQCYANMVTQGYAAIRAGDPNAVVLIGAASMLQIQPWTDDLLTDLAKQPLAGWHIAFSFHPYETHPEQVPSTVKTIRQIFAEHGLPKVPMWITEQGWPTCGSYSVSEATQAQYLVRAQVEAMVAGVAESLWYEFVDLAPPSSDREDCFGTLHNAGSPLGAYSPKQSYVTNVVLHQLLRGDSYAGADFTNGTRADATYGYWFTGADEVHVFWNANGASTVTIAAAKGWVEYSEMHGATSHPAGTVTIPVNQNPVYVVGTLTSVR